VEIKLNIPIKAVPHQSVRVTRFGRTYQPKKIADYKEQLRRAIGEQIPDGFVAFKADSEIAIVMLHYVFEYPKSFPKKIKENGKLHYKVTKPDLHDNLNKALFDAMEGIVWERDQNVVSMDNVKKYYSNSDCIIIHIKCLNC
jgi:Holliday junction resolvase RusA-like endonuclease